MNKVKVNHDAGENDEIFVNYCVGFKKRNYDINIEENTFTKIVQLSVIHYVSRIQRQEPILSV